ncbi:uncharacterized protein LOC128965837 [Oppia nitens]|uniref:uncharacterized protein LOC128965837 n=1 Tax=Oppia nitens TaxID=1686743 RepID=UPI0023DA6DFD|nr:uncharacterized protein LOC128965837 [Oppia nitens]
MVLRGGEQTHVKATDERQPNASIPVFITQPLSHDLYGYNADKEVFGTYKLIDSFKFNNKIQTTPTSQLSLPTQTPQNMTTKVSTAKSDNEEHWKQVIVPVVDNTPTTVPSINSPQTSPNRLLYANPVYNPAMARQIGMSTLMMSGLLYGLTMLPAIIALTTGSSPLAGLFSSLGRRKRSLVNESYTYRQLPLLNNEETYKFLKLFESTLAARKIENPICKKYYTCKVYYQVLKSGEKPKLPVFENAIINVFGIAVERRDFKLQLIPTVKMYYNVAKDALKGESCARRYPCPFQAHHYIKHGI